MTEIELRVVPPAAVAASWDGLCDRLSVTPFMRPGWFRAWAGAFGNGRLVVLTAHRRGSLVGVLPLEVRRGVAASPTNWHTPEFTVVAEDPRVSRALLHEAVRRNGRRLQLAYLDESTAEAVGECAGDHGHDVLHRAIERSPYVDLPDSFADYEQTLGRHFRKELARRRRRLLERGPLQLQVHGGAAAEQLEEFFRVEAAGWKGQSGTAIAADPRTRSFYTSVARWAADRGWLRLVLLESDGRAVAGDLAVECGSVHYLLKTGFDPEYRKYAPGQLLRHDVLQHVTAGGARTYEFLGADDAWKLEWTAKVRRRQFVQVFAPTFSGRVDEAAFRCGRPAAKWLVAVAGRAVSR